MSGLLGCSLLALLLAGNGLGTRSLETTIQDDALLLHRPEAQVQRTVRQMAELGVDQVRITAGWSALAPEPRASRRPRGGFVARDSHTYPEDGFDRLDRAVRAVAREGLEPQLDLGFWAPRWAVAEGGSQPERERYIPRARRFARFAEAVAERYSGRFPDPRQPARDLPAVRIYTTWNEPNHSSFLLPQWKRTRRGGFRPFSPHVYRAMHEMAYDAVKRVSAANQVLIGGTSSIGSPRPGSGHVPPLEFLRTMACVDRAMRPLRVRECRGTGPVRADGYAHHAYSLDTPPGVSAPNPDDVPIADLGRLADTIERLHDVGAIDRPWPLHVTEYGYETSPPDPYSRFTPEQQAAYIGWANYLAYREPRNRLYAQFLLRDIDAAESGFSRRSRRRWRDWQTGLLYADGRPKPAAQAFKIPLHAQLAVGADGRPAVLLFGGVRPGSETRIVRVEREDPVTGAWAPVDTLGTKCDRTTGEFATDADGFFRRLAPWHGPARYRLGWRRSSGLLEYGAAIPIVEQPLLPAS